MHINTTYFLKKKRRSDKFNPLTKSNLYNPIEKDNKRRINNMGRSKKQNKNSKNKILKRKNEYFMFKELVCDKTWLNDVYLYIWIYYFENIELRLDYFLSVYLNFAFHIANNTDVSKRAILLINYPFSLPKETDDVDEYFTFILNNSYYESIERIVYADSNDGKKQRKGSDTYEIKNGIAKLDEVSTNLYKDMNDEQLNILNFLKQKKIKSMIYMSDMFVTDQMALMFLIDNGENEAVTETESEIESEIESETENETESETESEIESETESEIESETESEINSETKSEAGREMEYEWMKKKGMINRKTKGKCTECKGTKIKTLDCNNIQYKEKRKNTNSRKRKEKYPALKKKELTSTEQEEYEERDENGILKGYDVIILRSSYEILYFYKVTSENTKKAVKRKRKKRANILSFVDCSKINVYDRKKADWQIVCTEKKGSMSKEINGNKMKTIQGSDSQSDKVSNSVLEQICHGSNKHVFNNPYDNSNCKDTSKGKLLQNLEGQSNLSDLHKKKKKRKKKKKKKNRRRVRATTRARKREMESEKELESEVELESEKELESEVELESEKELESEVELESEKELESKEEKREAKMGMDMRMKVDVDREQNKKKKKEMEKYIGMDTNIDMKKELTMESGCLNIKSLTWKLHLSDKQDYKETVILDSLSICSGMDGYVENANENCNTILNDDFYYLVKYGKKLSIYRLIYAVSTLLSTKFKPIAYVPNWWYHETAKCDEYLEEPHKIHLFVFDELKKDGLIVVGTSQTGSTLTMDQNDVALCMELMEENNAILCTNNNDLVEYVNMGKYGRVSKFIAHDTFFILTNYL